MTLRAAVEADIPAMHRVRLAVRENRLSRPDLVRPEDYRRLLAADGAGWVCERNGRIVGFAVGDLARGDLWALFVEPGHERAGLGRRLHDALLARMFAAGAARLWLTTAPGTRAERFYLRAGWRCAGRTPGGEARYEIDAAAFRSPPPELGFARLAAADLPLLGAWLRAPHVARWFGEPTEWLAEIAANLEAPWVTYARVECDAAPLGFAQAYRTELAPPGVWSREPPGTLGLDFLLGRPQDLGRGLGHALVAQWSAWCEGRLGARRLVADPDAGNEPSVRVLRACGFVPDARTGLWVREVRVLAALAGGAAGRIPN